MNRKQEDNKFSGLRSLRQTKLDQEAGQTAKQSGGETAEQETVKATFYLLSSQPDDIDEWQLAIKRATGKRVEKSELVRYALSLLSKQFASKTAKEVYEEMQQVL